MKNSLRYGYTTGACAAAAAKAAALLLRDRRPVDVVDITLPRGESALFSLVKQRLEDDTAICSVIKDAGDDPDITNGAEIEANVSLVNGANRVIIEGGTGVGRVTKPGLAVPVGEWAINPVPRRMIEEAVRSVFADGCQHAGIRVVISIPNGENLAKRTLNARLGIIGGLSILGTTGIVKPISADAWTDTITAALDVAVACGSRTVVLATGRTSEMVAQRFFANSQTPLPEESYVMMGDHVGYAVRGAAKKGVAEIVLACQFAKLVKIACGHEQTHVSSSELDLQALAEWIAAAPRTSVLEPLARRANTARELLDESGHDPALVELVCSRATSFVRHLAPGVSVKVLLAGYDSSVLYFG